MEAFKEIVLPLLDKYQPQFLISQFGVDGHYQDPLVGLRLTTHAYEAVALSMHDSAHTLCEGKCLVLGGGGYQPRNVARCWTIMFLGLLGKHSSKDTGLTGLHDPEPTVSSQFVRESVEKTIDKIKDKVFPIHGLS